MLWQLNTYNKNTLELAECLHWDKHQIADVAINEEKINQLLKSDIEFDLNTCIDIKNKIVIKTKISLN
jgi:hypothetical protein